MAKYGTRETMEKEGPKYDALKAGQYIAKMTNLKTEEKKNYDGNLVEMISINFLPYESNTRKPDMFDIKAQSVKPLSRKLFLDFEKISMGFRDNFTVPSKFRSLAAALQGLDAHGEVDGPDELTVESAMDFLNEFDGSYVVVNVTAIEKNGKTRNKIVDFLPTDTDFSPDPMVEAEAEQKAKERADKDRYNNDDRKRGSSAKEEEPDVIEDSADEDDEEEAPKTSKPAKKAKNDTRKPLF